MKRVRNDQAGHIDRRLREDIRHLGEILGNVLKVQQGIGFYRQVERLRGLTKSFRQTGRRSAFNRIRSMVDRLSVDRARSVVRAFHIYFLLANAADEAHRIRSQISHRGSAGAPSDSPMEYVMQSLRARGALQASLKAFLSNVRISPVFTAHPTEATRQTILRRVRHITELLLRSDREADGRRNDDPVWRELEAEVTLLWQTSELRFNRITVQDEVQRGLYFFENILYEAVPRLCRSIEAAAQGERPGVLLDRPPVVLGSWMGGDRDGHPFVTPEVTRQTLKTLRSSLLGLYQRDVERLYNLLSPSEDIVPISSSLSRWIGRNRHLLEIRGGSLHIEPSEAYRLALRILHARLERTRQAASRGYAASGEFAADLLRIRESLSTNRASSVSELYLTPLIRKVNAFRFAFARLDVRQNSRAVRRTVAAYLRAAGAEKRFDGLGESAKQAVLLREIAGRTRRRARLRFDGMEERVLEEFEVIGWAHGAADPWATGTYILSHTERVSDLLEILFLAKETGLVTVNRGRIRSSRFDIVPLFETIDDLRRSEGIMRSLFQLPLYRSHLATRGNRQEIMIGYSDSSKDGGIVASAFSLYNAQITLHQLAAEFGISLTFFHGRGGSTSRGGGPVYESILAQPRETLGRSIRITEQGEMISTKYLMPQAAVYSLEVMTAAMFFGSSTPLGPRELAERDRRRRLFTPISNRSLNAYRALIGTPDFWNYFREVTPIDVIEQIEIGSRPASRANDVTFESLRAIPWVFAWTQNRQAITGWYGFGSGIQQSVEAGEIRWEDLRTMYRSWLFFRSLVDNVEMVLQKADMEIGRLYLLCSGSPSSSRHLFRRIRAEYDRTKAAVLAIKKSSILLEKNLPLRQSLLLRNPYMDPINFIQVRFIKTYRKPGITAIERRKLIELLRSTVNGIAAGMRNTG